MKEALEMNYDVLWNQPDFCLAFLKTIRGTLLKPTQQPPWYNRRILEEERPDLAGLDGKIRLEREEAALMDMFIREKSYIQPGDLIVTDDKLSPGCLPSIKMLDEAEIEKAKVAAWQDYSAFENGNPLLSSLHIHMIFELIRSTRDSFDYDLARKIVCEALDSNLNGPLILEWAPNTRVALPPLEGQRITTQAKGIQRVMTPQAKLQRVVMDKLLQQVDRAYEGTMANQQQRRQLTAEGTMATVGSDEKLMRNNRQQKTPRERTP
ncbi:unnamed protein product [Angiostrongylus costaricensis]|uniref:Uncharacterized protein n=1 Tax=Angiostrongylus costaricensis TaxID=334426 RepID=A0A0R3PXW9_ANGCS|nr:unnamed protein product [Angiostrongylus costaricensis]